MSGFKRCAMLSAIKKWITILQTLSKARQTIFLLLLTQNHAKFIRLGKNVERQNIKSETS